MTQKIDTSMLEDVASKTPAGPQDTDVGKVVQLNSLGLIPGEYLGGGSLSLVDGRHLALEIADLKGAALNFGAGQADPFDSDTIGATSTNETYDASYDWYQNTSASYGSTVITSGLTTSGEDGSVTNTGNAIDNDTGTLASLSVPLPAGSKWWKVDMGAGNAKTVTKATIHWQNNSDISNYLSGVTIEGSNNDSDYTELLNDTSGATANQSKDYTWTNSTAYRYLRVKVKSQNTASGNANLHIVEIDFFEPGPATDMTLINSGLTAASAPSTGRISVQAQFVDSATINTDLTAEISRDGGTTWTTATLTAGPTNANFTMYSGEATISAQPSGTSMKYRVKTLNNKSIRVSGVVLRWS